MKSSKGLVKAFIITLAVALLAVAFIVLNLMGIINLGFGGASKTARTEGKGYNSPEECMEAYMEYMKNGDYQGMLSCYAIESAVEHYDMEAYIERLTCIAPTFTLVSKSDEFSTKLSADMLRGSVAKDIRYGTWNLYGSTLFTDGLVVSLEDNDAKDLIEEYIPSDLAECLSGIKYKGIVDEDDDIIADYVSSDNLKDNIKEYKKMYGADEYQPMIADFSLDHDDYYFFGDCIEYDGKWYLCPTNRFWSSLFGITTYEGYITLQENVY